MKMLWFSQILLENKLIIHVDDSMKCNTTGDTNSSLTNTKIMYLNIKGLRDKESSLSNLSVDN